MRRFALPALAVAACIAGTPLRGTMVGGTALAQTSPPGTQPSAEQIARALSLPAMRITPSMLQGPTRGIVPAGAPPAAPTYAALPVATTAPPAGTAPTAMAAASVPAAPSGGTSAGAARAAARTATAADPCPPASGVCALTIEFETGSAGLTSRAVTTLDSLGKALATLQDSGFRFRLEGHTDTVGSETYNLTLSERRAAAVAAYLASHYGIDPARLQPVGMGKEHPLVVTPDQTPEARNRRVEVVNLGA
ncbi:MAG: hypothetical protein BGO51_18540 [Rhodospirillales bacterium 69-11]|nr:OmpA family protein [Rhodospirillales bacterium]OJW21776.1 MAG: hypothetical protein BGO51_18540 [Rhodospirillales bacterium 69-11]